MCLEHEIAYMRIILSLLLSLLTTPLFGQAGGKGIYYINQNKSSLVQDRWVEFEGSTAVMITDHMDKDKVVSVYSEPLDYFTSASSIRWYTDAFSWDLDRKTLELIRMYPATGNTIDFACEVFQSDSEFRRKQREIRGLMQSEYNERSRGNKI